MIRKARPGELLWCAEGGAVKQVEVVGQVHQIRACCSGDEISIKYPNDDVMNPWYCWNGYLFRSRKAALRQAHRQLQNQLSDRIADMELARIDIQEIKRSIQQLEEELQKA